MDGQDGADGLARQLALHREQCVHCGLCVRECAFLQENGTPGAIAANRGGREPELAFACSLCGLCGAVCPPAVGLRPDRLFLAMRREAVARGRADLAPYRALLFYEKMGSSRWLAGAFLPRDCDTVFFPGCALPGSRPDLLRGLVAHLRRNMPRLGIVLDCCTKPSHDLGRQEYFESRFHGLRRELLARGVRNVLVACPSCHRVFRHHGHGLRVSTVYEHMEPLPRAGHPPVEVTVHDPCGAREEPAIHAAVRRLAEAGSLTVREMEHHGARTICCGEGGAAGCVRPEFARQWSRRRKEEAGNRRVVTCCAGCLGFLEPLVETSHILDLLLMPGAALAGRLRISRPPRTYLNRFFLKRWLGKMFAGCQRLR